MTISLVWNYFLNTQPLKLKALHPIEMLQNTILVTHYHIPEDLNSQSVGYSALWVTSVRSRLLHVSRRRTKSYKLSDSLLHKIYVVEHFI